MLNKELFFSLCEKYDIELSDKVNTPMIREENEIHAITYEDIERAFAPYQMCFDYSSSEVNTNIPSTAYYIQDDFALAC